MTLLLFKFIFKTQKTLQALVIAYLVVLLHGVFLVLALCVIVVPISDVCVMCSIGFISTCE